MKRGNWIPIDRNVIYHLSPIAKEGQYSEQSAYLSLREDLEKNEIKGLREYSRMWKWSPKKVFDFFQKVGYKTGETLETLWKHFGNTLETPIRIVFNNLDDSKKTKRKHFGNTLETHTNNPIILNPNIKDSTPLPPKGGKRKSLSREEFLQMITNALEKIGQKRMLDPLKETLLTFYEMRKEINRPFKSTQAITQMVNNLAENSNLDYKIAKAMIEQSIANQYQGIFPLKSTNGKYQSKLEPDPVYKKL